MTRSMRAIRLFALLLAAWLIPVAGLSATTPRPLTAQDVEAWSDGLLPYAIDQGRIAGGVVSVVKDGRLLFAKGYGYADIASRRPMDPARTIIRPGSISKLFTWTAVMQQVELGRLDLDADINRYLDFRIPPYRGRPITLRDLVTHSAGFEESFRDILGRDPPISLERYVKTNLPARVYPPGKVPSYSNYGSALAAYIVERVSGERFTAYAARHILRPLGMARSTFAQPVPAAWRGDLATGYLTADTAPGYFEYSAISPAGGLNTTATDMARFMIAHLQNGQLGDARILSDATARAMHAPQRRFFPALTAMATGFYETSRNGHRSIAHNGGTQYFHSDLHLLVDDGVGIFISLNSAGDDAAATRIHAALFDGFMNRYFPATATPPPAMIAPDAARAQARAVAGYWEPARRSETSWFALANLLGPMTIDDDGDGRVSLPFPGRGTVHWTAVAPDLWRSTDQGDAMQAIMTDGQPTMLGFDAAPPIAFLPVPWWRSPGWIIPALSAALGLLLAHGLALPAGAIARRIHGVAPAHRGIRHAAPHLLSLALVAVAIAYPATMLWMGADLSRMSASTDTLVYALQAITLLLLTTATLLAIRALVAAWKDGLSVWRKLAAVALPGALAMLWWVVIAFRLANFSLRY